MAVPGPFAVAIHVIDGLATRESEAIVGSLNDDTYDPAPKQNADAPQSRSSGGCGCRLGGGRTDIGFALALFALLGTVARRRRQQ
jgi:MYXO-CTERM domain-containing protein